MSTASARTKVAGMKLGAEPKKIAILAVLLVVAIGMFVYNSSSGGGENSAVPQTHSSVATTPITPAAHARDRATRRSNSVRDRGALRIQPVDPRNGDVDPTLRLDLLARLQSVQPIEGGRSLFELGPAAASNTPLPAVKIVPKPVSGMNAIHPTVAAPPAFSIPLKFYGFERLKNKLSGNRGFFLDGDNILVASEGDLLKQRYLVVELTPGGAKLEDTQLKKGSVLPLVPEARNEQ